MADHERTFVVTVAGVEVVARFRRTQQGWVNVDPIEVVPASFGVTRPFVVRTGVENGGH